ncbi:MAG: hypothetical protein EHM58_07270 [Ignavibacteriae bacterium]|nr:MAG: hypothetical protein EHM58_07270 [Ignavibacteriota bacterium]
MDKNQEHLNNLTEIRSLMERSSTFISLSGLSGISAGIIGLIASVFFYRTTASVTEPYTYAVLERTIIELIIIGAVTVILAFAAAIFFTSLKAKKKGQPLWSVSARRLLVNLFIPLITGGVFCLFLLYNLYLNLLVPSMIIFYGLALINASKYTLSQVKYLGISELVVGLISLFYVDYAIHFWAIAFGVLNIIYGTIMYMTNEK